MALVLVVEDDPDMAYLAVGLLRRMGHRSIVASDGNLGAALVENHSSELSLVVLDMNLPGIQGGEIFSRIRRNPRTVNLPVLIVTAQHLPNGTAPQTDYAPDAYLAKPYAMPDLRTAVDSLIGAADH